MISGAIQAIAALASGIMNWASTNRTNLQNKLNYEDWKSYNSPANQMDRLKDAGLNPYMVNGVNNTLSQPFQIGNNLGISEGLSQFSQAVGNAAGRAENIRNHNLQNNISNKKLSLENENLKLRERMTKVAEKKGDAYTALLWSQGSIADLNAKFWKEVADVRVNKFISDATIAASNADFLTEFNPLRLGYYHNFYPLALEGQKARNANTRANTSHIYWSQHFMQDKFEREMALAWAKYNLSSEIGLGNLNLNAQRVYNDYLLGSGRLDLQRDYFDLAKKKWYSDMFFNGMGLLGKSRDRAARLIPMLIK